MQDTRSLLRSAALQSKPMRRSSFEYNGQVFEVVAPTVRERREATKESKDAAGVLDETKFIYLLLISCVVVPGTDDKVLDRTDFDSFMEARDQDFAEAAAPVLTELLGKDEKK